MGIETINNVNDAANAAEEWEPTPIYLGQNHYAKVNKLQWKKWKKIWSQIQTLIAAAAEGWDAFEKQAEATALFRETTAIPVNNRQLVETAEGDKFSLMDGETFTAITKMTEKVLERSQGNFKVLLKEVIGRLGDVPGLIEEVLLGCLDIDDVRVTLTQLDEWDGGQLLMLFHEALRINYFENQDIQAFLPVVQRFFKVREPLQTEEVKEPETPAPLEVETQPAQEE